MKTIRLPQREGWGSLLRRTLIDDASLSSRVEEICQAVKRDGDAALHRFSRELDGVELDTFRVTSGEFAEARKTVSDRLKSALQLAGQNIHKFHTAQVPQSSVIETMPGVACWQRNIAIAPVGFYIPGGTAPLFSSILMLGVPAQIAGCDEIILCTPPDKQGGIHPALLYTAELMGIEHVFKIGGAQAIAAMAYGTKSVPKVLKIFGPGNQYVTAAKRIVSRGHIAIDLPAGPTELIVFADGTCDPAFVAADLLAQAEHGEDSQLILIAREERIIQSVLSELERRLPRLPRRKIAQKSLNNGYCLLVEDADEAMTFINAYAPEHLILAVENAEILAQEVFNAGSVFLGNFSPESAGDYASGTNHILPTSGCANRYSGVSVDAFVKKITFQRISKAGLGQLSDSVQCMSEAEGLQGHSLAVAVRFSDAE